MIASEAAATSQSKSFIASLTRMYPPALARLIMAARDGGVGGRVAAAALRHKSGKISHPLPL